MIKVVYFEPDWYIDANIVNFDDFKKYGKPLASGEPFDSSFPQMDLFIRGKPGDIFKSGIWTIVSKKFVELLRQLGCDEYFQSFPVNVSNPKVRRVFDGYSIIHVTHQVDCFDESNSRFEIKNGHYASTSVKRLFIDESKVSDNDLLFRIKNYPKMLIILNSITAPKFEEAKLKGVQLYSFTEWNQSSPELSLDV